MDCKTLLTFFILSFAGVALSTWTSVPLTVFLSSNLMTAGTFSYSIPSIIPSNASEVLIYVRLYSGNSNTGPNHDLKIFTRIGNVQYEKYFYVYSYSQHAVSINSDNMWLPMPENRLVYLIVPAPHGGNVQLRFCAIGYR